MTFSGPQSALDDATPQYLANGNYLIGSSAVNYAAGYAGGNNRLNVTLFNAQTVGLTATLSPGSESGIEPLNVTASTTVAGLGLAAITEDVTPLLTYSGAIGSLSGS